MSGVWAAAIAEVARCRPYVHVGGGSGALDALVAAGVDVRAHVQVDPSGCPTPAPGPVPTLHLTAPGGELATQAELLGRTLEGSAGSIAAFFDDVDPGREASAVTMYAIPAAAVGGRTRWASDPALARSLEAKQELGAVLDGVLPWMPTDAGCPLPPGDPGAVLLTGLLNPLLPMIRYRIGDGAVWADRPCACGDPLPALVTIAGRVFDWLIDDEGRRVAPQRLWMSTLLPERSHLVRRYRMAQDRTGRVVIEVVGPELTDGDFQDVGTGAQRVVGAATEVEVRRLEEIVTPPGRRFRLFTSERAAPDSR